MSKIKILILLIVIIGCKNNSTNSKENLISDKFEISKSELNGQPILLPLESLSEIYGKPTQVVDSCATSQIVPNQGEFVLSCNLYDKKWDLVYRNYKNIAFLGHLNFPKTNYELRLPKITLSKETTITEVNKVYPNPYIKSNGVGSDGLEWVYFYDDLNTKRKIEPNLVMLGFKNGKLVHFNYDWFPEYSDLEYENYLKWIKKGNS